VTFSFHRQLEAYGIRSSRSTSVNIADEYCHDEVLEQRATMSRPGRTAPAKLGALLVARAVRGSNSSICCCFCRARCSALGAVTNHGDGGYPGRSRRRARQAGARSAPGTNLRHAPGPPGVLCRNLRRREPSRRPSGPMSTAWVAAGNLGGQQNHAHAPRETESSRRERVAEILLQAAGPRTRSRPAGLHPLGTTAGGGSRRGP